MSKTDRRNAAAAQAAAHTAELAAQAAWQAIPQEQRDQIKVGQLVRERQEAADILSSVAAQEAAGITLPDTAYLFPARTPSGGLKRDETGAIIRLDARDVVAEADRRAVKAGRMSAAGRYLPADPDRMTGRDLLNLARRAAWHEIRARVGKGWRLTLDEQRDLAADLTAHGVEAAIRRDPATVDGWHPPMIFRDVESTPRWSAMPGKGEPRDRWLAFLRNQCRKHLAAEQTEREAAKTAAAVAARDPEALAAVAADRVSTLAADAAAIVAAVAADLAAAGRPLGKLEADGLTAQLDGLTHRERAQLQGISEVAAKSNAKRGRMAMRKRWPNPADAAAELRAAAGRARTERAAAELAAVAAGPWPVLAAEWGTVPAHPAYMEAAERAAADIRRMAERAPSRRATRAAMRAAERAERADLAALAAELGRAIRRPAEGDRMAADILSGYTGQRPGWAPDVRMPAPPSGFRWQAAADLSGAVTLPAPDRALQAAPIIFPAPGDRARVRWIIAAMATVHQAAQAAAERAAIGARVADTAAELDAIRSAYGWDAWQAAQAAERKNRHPHTGGSRNAAQGAAQAATNARQYPEGMARYSVARPYTVSVLPAAERPAGAPRMEGVRKLRGRALTAAAQSSR